MSCKSAEAADGQAGFAIDFGLQYMRAAKSYFEGRAARVGAGQVVAGLGRSAMRQRYRSVTSARKMVGPE